MDGDFAQLENITRFRRDVADWVAGHLADRSLSNCRDGKLMREFVKENRRKDGASETTKILGRNQSGPPLLMLYSSSECGRHLMTQPVIKRESKLVLEDVMNRPQSRYKSS